MATKSRYFTVGAECAVSFNGTGMVAKGENLSCDYQWYQPEDGLIASKEPLKSRRLHLKQDVRGDVTFTPSYDEGIQILAAIFSTAGTSTDAVSFSGYTARVLPTDPGSTLVDLEVNRKHASGKTFLYADAWVPKVTVKSSENQPVEMTLDILGKQELEGTNTIPAAAAASPAIMDDLTVYIGTDEYCATDVEVTVDLQMDERFHNSLTRTHAQPKVLNVTGKIGLDLNTDNWPVFQKNATDNDSYAIGIKWTDATDGFGFWMPVCCITSKTPSIGGPDVQKPTLEFRAYRNGAVDPTVVVFTKT